VSAAHPGPGAGGTEAQHSASSRIGPVQITAIAAQFGEELLQTISREELEFKRTSRGIGISGDGFGSPHAP